MHNTSNTKCAKHRLQLKDICRLITDLKSKYFSRSNCIAAMLLMFCSGLSNAGAILVDANGLINVQFGENDNVFGITSQYNGPGVVSGGGSNNWNLIAGSFTRSGSSATNIALTNAAAASTGVTLSYSTPGGFYDAGGTGIFAGTPQQNLMTSYLFADTSATAGPGIVSLGGLTPNAYYELLLYSAGDVAGRGTKFSVGGVQQIVTPVSSTLSLNNSFGEFIARSDASGNLNISMASAGTSVFPEANLNGLQLLAIPQVAQHDLINIQFGENDNVFGITPQYNGPGVVSAAGSNNWNLIAGNFFGGANGSGISLFDAAGTPTAVSLSYSTLGFFDAGISGIFNGTPEQDLLTSYTYADTGAVGRPGTVTLSGLNPGGRYQLILDSAANDIGRTTLFSVAGMDQTVSPTGIPTQGLGDSYAEFTVTADLAGEIIISMSGVATGGPAFPEANLNGIQLIALPASVPEPPSALIVLTALMGLAWLRKPKPGCEALKQQILT